MQQIDEGRLRFLFPDNTVASKYDEWSFYRNQFNSAFGGTKAVDLIHVDGRHSPPPDFPGARATIPNPETG